MSICSLDGGAPSACAASLYIALMSSQRKRNASAAVACGGTVGTVFESRVAWFSQRSAELEWRPQPTRLTHLLHMRPHEADRHRQGAARFQHVRQRAHGAHTDGSDSQQHRIDTFLAQPITDLVRQILCRRGVGGTHHGVAGQSETANARGAAHACVPRLSPGRQGRTGDERRLRQSGRRGPGSGHPGRRPSGPLGDCATYRHDTTGNGGCIVVSRQRRRP